MQVVDPIIDEVPFQRGRDPRERPLWLLPWGLALALGAGLEASAPPAHLAVEPDFFVVRSAENSASAPAGKVSNPYGALVDPGFFHVSNPASPNRYSPLRASLDVGPEILAAQSAVDLPSAAAAKVSSPYGALVDVFSDSKSASPSRQALLLASLEAAPPAAAAAIPPPPDVTSPPKRDVARIDDAAPLPPARPAEFGSLAAPAEPDRRAPRVAERAAPATPPADDRNIFQKLFGPGCQSGAALVYATPESDAAARARAGAPAAAGRASGLSIFARSAPPSGYDQWTAVYDISARTVYLPDGTRLEAHSGLGDRLDDPRFVSERGRGATPPHLYELERREDLFHGVAALRLTPIGDGDVFGRAGLLAHSYMLGPNGDSNGCVSFKDYDAFLRAYQQGQVKRLAVVARLD
jgi:hypothetical protein